MSYFPFNVGMTQLSSSSNAPALPDESTRITTSSFLEVSKLKLQQVGLFVPGVGGVDMSVMVPKFLNRILGLSSAWQRVLFDLFFNILEELIRVAKREQR